MADSIFDLFNNFDFSEFGKLLDSWKVTATDKYNDFVNNKIKKYDLKTQAGYEAFIEEAADIRKKLLESDSIFSKTLINWLDAVVKKAMEEHNANLNTNKDTVNEIVNAEVNRVNNENKKPVKKYVEEAPSEPDVWPSDRLSERQKRNVWRIVDQYMDKMIVPYLPDDVDEDAVNDMACGLFEFAAYVLNLDEEE